MTELKALQPMPDDSRTWYRDSGRRRMMTPRGLSRYVAAAAMILAACAAPGRSLESAPEVAVAGVRAALHEPVWSYHTDALLGLTDDHRLAKITDLAGGSPAMYRSAPIATGKNIQVSRKDDRHICTWMSPCRPATAPR